MSSHHIVREKQEPALLVLGLGDFNYEQLGQLLEWSPTVIATQQTAELLLSLNIKIDWLISDNPLIIIQADIKTLATNNKEIPLITALNFLINEGYPSVNIISEDFSPNEYAIFNEKINIVVFCRQYKIYSIPSGYSKWKPKGDFIEIITTNLLPDTKGLRHIENNQYVTENDGFFTITFGKEPVFIAERL